VVTGKLSAMNASVDAKTCIGCASCTVVAPKSFKMAKNGKAEAVSPAGDGEDLVKEAAEGCPVQAIKLEE